MDTLEQSAIDAESADTYPDQSKQTPDTLKLTNTQLGLLASIYDSKTPKIANDLASTGEKHRAARDYLLQIGLIKSSPRGILITDEGQQYLIDFALLSPSGELSQDARKLMTQHVQAESFALLKQLTTTKSQSFLIFEWYVTYQDSTVAELRPFISTNNIDGINKLLQLRVHDQELRESLIRYYTAPIEVLEDDSDIVNKVKKAQKMLNEVLDSLSTSYSNFTESQLTKYEQIQSLAYYNFIPTRPQEFSFFLNCLIESIDSNLFSSSQKPIGDVLNKISNIF